MNRVIRMTLAAGSLAATAMWAGCAKQQVVKPDQMVPAAAATAPAAPLAKTGTATEIKPEIQQVGISGGEIKEAPAQSMAAPSATAGDAAGKAALEKVFFNFDSADLSSEARETLTKNAAALKKEAGTRVRIEGHCDDLGSDDYNLALGERRARAAQRYLQTLGVSAERLSIISYGKEKPADAGRDDAARARNRRDEFTVSSR